MCLRYILTLSLSLVSPSPVSPTYKVKTIACEAIFQFKSDLNFFKGVVIIDQEMQHSYLLSLQLNVPDKTSANFALVKSFLRLGD